MNLFLDDDYARTPSTVTWAEWSGQRWDWVIVRYVSEFKRRIELYGMPKRISLDHDMCPVHYAIYKEPDIALRMVADGIEIPPTGRDALVWLLNRCIEFELVRPIVYMHSLNGEGVKNMKSLVRSFDEAHPHLMPARE